MVPTFRKLAAAALVALLALAGCSDDEDQAQVGEADADAEAFFYHRLEPHRDDLPEMRERGVVRALVTLNMSEFFLLKGQPRGFEYELLQGYEKFLNKGVSKKEGRTQIVFVPVAFDEAIEALRDGRGDLIAAGMTVTPERQKLVTFTEPYFSKVDEIVVANEDVGELTSLDDLAGREVTVLAGSSYITHLEELNEVLDDRDLDEIEIREADPVLSGDDVLKMVNAGIFDITVADSHLVSAWADSLDNVNIYKDLKVNSGGQIAWAVRKDSDRLRKSLNGYLVKNKKGTTVGNVLFRRYFKNNKFIENPLAKKEIKKFEKLSGLFRTYSKMYGFDWLASMAQAYQESGLDQKARSHAGAVGIMQLLPSTAADPNVGIPNIEKLENNIHAGIKYMHFLRERYFSGSELSPANRLAFSLAAYNMGPGRLAKLRKRAKGMGLDANKWFGNVEMVALAKVGSEPVTYVSNIHEYYVAYRLHMERESAKAKLIN